jgi:hypothetical protein
MRREPETIGAQTCSVLKLEEAHEFSPLVRVYINLYPAVRLKTGFKGGGQVENSVNVARSGKIALRGLLDAVSVLRSEVNPISLASDVMPLLQKLAGYWTMLMYFSHLTSITNSLLCWEHEEAATRVAVLNGWLTRVEVWEERCTIFSTQLTQMKPSLSMTTEILTASNIIPALKKIITLDSAFWCHNTCHFNLVTRTRWIINDWQPLIHRAEPPPFSRNMRSVLFSSNSDFSPQPFPAIANPFLLVTSQSPAEASINRTETLPPLCAGVRGPETPFDPGCPLTGSTIPFTSLT